MFLNTLENLNAKKKKQKVNLLMITVWDFLSPLLNPS